MSSVAPVPFSKAANARRKRPQRSRSPSSPDQSIHHLFITRAVGVALPHSPFWQVISEARREGQASQPASDFETDDQKKAESLEPTQSLICKSFTPPRCSLWFTTPGHPVDERLEASAGQSIEFKVILGIGNQPHFRLSRVYNNTVESRLPIAA